MEQTSSRERLRRVTDDASTTANRREEVTSRRSMVRRGSSVRCRAPDRRHYSHIVAFDVLMTDGARHGDWHTEESWLEKHRRTIVKQIEKLLVDEIVAIPLVILQRAFHQLLYLRANPQQARSQSRIVTDRNSVNQYLKRDWPSYVLRKLFHKNRPLPEVVEPARVLWHPRLHTPEWVESQSKCDKHDTDECRCYITPPLKITITPNKI